MLNGTAKADTNFERPVLEEGTYPAKLVKAIVMMGKATQYQPDGAPKIMLIWETELEGETYEIVDYLGFPKNLAYNEKSKFWAKLGEIVGQKISSENAQQWGISFGPLDSFIQSYDDLVGHISTVGDNGKNEKAEITRMTWGADDLLGVQRQLVVKIWDNGQRQGNDIAAIMGAKKAGGVRKPGAAPQATPAGGLPIHDAPPSTGDLPY